MTQPTITKKLAVQLAREAGAHDAGHNYFGMSETKIHTLAQAIYKLGRNAGLEAAKQAASDISESSGGSQYNMFGKDLAEQCTDLTESLKDNTPATLPDWMRDDAEDEQALMDRDMGDN